MITYINIKLLKFTSILEWKSDKRSKKNLA